jgi:hypothetical protein
LLSFSRFNDESPIISLSYDMHQIGFFRDELTRDYEQLPIESKKGPQFGFSNTGHRIPLFKIGDWNHITVSRGVDSDGMFVFCAFVNGEVEYYLKQDSDQQTGEICSIYSFPLCANFFGSPDLNASTNTFNLRFLFFTISLNFVHQSLTPFLSKPRGII